MKLEITEHPRRSVAHPARIEVRLRAEDGTTGVVDAHPAARPMIETLVADHLAGADPRGIGALYDRMTAAESKACCDSRASAALDVALWRFAAQRRQEPLWQALGGGPPLSDHHLRAPAGKCQDADFRAWCVRMSADARVRGIMLTADDEESDLRCLQHIEDAFRAAGRPVSLMMDFAGRHAPKEVERRVARIERRFTLDLVEGPARIGDFLGYRRVSRSIAASVCAPRGLDAASDYLAYLHEHALDVVQVDLDTMGYTGALRIADAAYAFELPVIIASSPGDAGAELSGALPYCLSIELEGEVSRTASGLGLQR